MPATTPATMPARATKSEHATVWLVWHVWHVWHVHTRAHSLLDAAFCLSVILSPSESAIPCVFERMRM